MPHSRLSPRALSAPRSTPGTLTASPLSPTGWPLGIGFGAKMGRVMSGN